MLEVAGFSGDAPAALQAALASGRGYATFEAMLAAQGARPGALERLAPHPSSTPVRAARPGFVTAVDPVMLGELARDLVARDGSRAGIVVAARTGDRLAAGALLATVYGSPEFAEAVRAAFSLGEHAPPARPLVYCEIGAGCETGAGADGGGAASASGDARSMLEIK
jgi:thymidine phosphorylase